MSPLEALLAQVATLFQSRKQPWALVGGMAVSVRTEPRFTRDIDLAVAVADDREAESLIQHLRGSGFRVLTLAEQDAAHRLATVRLACSGNERRGAVLDLLFASSGIEPEICAAAETLKVFPGLAVPVARLHHLMVLKALARDDRTRPQDAADLRQLILEAQPSDLAAACEAASLIEARGFNRSRNLPEALQAAWRAFRP
jgi:predicted nucleotidyltransferase